MKQINENRPPIVLKIKTKYFKKKKTTRKRKRLKDENLAPVKKVEVKNDNEKKQMDEKKTSYCAKNKKRTFKKEKYY